MNRHTAGATGVQASVLGNRAGRSMVGLLDLRQWGVAVMLATLAGCSTQAPRDSRGPTATAVMPQALGDEIVLRALAQIGTAYRYGGADLEGFDCSGLVFFIHQELGLSAPRTAQQQYDASVRVARSELRPGDLVFFRFSGPRISHVGIYAGAGRFVHAPQTGRNVELKTLSDEYYAKHFAGAGRLQALASRS